MVNQLNGPGGKIAQGAIYFVKNGVSKVWWNQGRLFQRLGKNLLQKFRLIAWFWSLPGANLLKLWPALRTFAWVAGVSPTNHRAERVWRGAVLWRQGCFGNQGDNGSRFTASILTTVATLRQQDRNIVEYVVAAIQAHRTGQLAPSLLPLDQLIVEAA